MEYKEPRSDKFEKKSGEEDQPGENVDEQDENGKSMYEMDIEEDLREEVIDASEYDELVEPEAAKQTDQSVLQ